MALFEQYTKPGVYTRETVEDPGIILFGDLRIPVFVGEGQETRSYKNIELHRGSSAVADDLVVKENISDQVTGLIREFVLGYGPVVKGDGTGTTTNTPTDITVLADGVPATVTSLNGATKTFQLHDIYALGTNLEVTYYFKRQDTLVENEDLAPQVPLFATWSADANLALTLTTPGELGNAVSLALTSVAPASDALAVSGAGSNTIAIELLKSERTLSTLGSTAWALSGSTVTRTTGSWLTDGCLVGDAVKFNTALNITPAGTHALITNIDVTGKIMTVDATLVNETVATPAADDVYVYEVRTYGDINNILEVGIPTPSGYITLQTAGSLTAMATESVLAVASNLFRDGAGPNTNVSFKLSNVPVVDGTNGGVVTTNPEFVTVKINNVKTTVKAIDGLTGLVTLATPVLGGQTLTATYYTNTYQDTYDLLPAANVATLDLVGFGPDREDFINTVDYVLETPVGKTARIQWGASSNTATGVWTAGYTPFDAAIITTTLVDERMYLQPVQGVVDGKNAIFTLLDVPTDGSGLSRPTNNPALVHVYVGLDPVSALAAGEVRVIQCFGESKTIKLYTPPAAGKLIFASYYRNTLNDHTYTLEVVNPGIVGQGTYKVTNELGDVLPVAKNGNAVVSEANFVTAGGIVWPASFSDLSTVPGKSPDETVTVTFMSGDDDFVVSQATQGTLTSAVNAGLRFRSTTTGSAAGQSAVSIQFVGTTQKADNEAVDFVADAISIYITKSGGGTRSLADVIALFSAPNPIPTRTATGVIICEPVSGSTVLTGNAVAGIAENFVNGVNAVTTPRSVHFNVTSSRTAGDALADGLGRTGGATTGATGAIGYLGQTFADATTGVKFTIVDPNIPVEALGVYGLTSLPSPSYHYRPGDTLTFTVSKALARVTSAVPTIDLAGLRTKVGTTYGMHIGDTAVVTSYNKAGSEPLVGDFYYISYTTYKTDDDFALKIYTNASDAYAQYGDPNPTNKLSLAARLFSQNGGEVFGCVQVRKDTGMEVAADASFNAAISALAAPLPGSDRKADMIVPLTTSPYVIQHLNRHLITQGSQRMSGEAIGIYGHDFYATPETMRGLARSLKAERLIGIAVPGAILEIDTNGKTAEFAVGGEFLAAAMTGLTLNPANDVATTLTKQSLVGFSRLIKRYDDPTMDLMAADGLTCLVERSGSFLIRHWVTTDNTSPLKREPTSRLIIDYVRKIVRRNLDQFIGRKLLQSAINSVTVVTTSTLKALTEQEIIEGFKNLQITRDEYDPTVLHVKFFVKPIFSLLWIDVSLTVTTKL